MRPLPELTRSRGGALQLIASFLAQHPESSKNWVEIHLKEVATLVDKSWCIKEGVLAAHGAHTRFQLIIV